MTKFPNTLGKKKENILLVSPYLSCSCIDTITQNVQENQGIKQG